MINKHSEDTILFNKELLSELLKHYPLDKHDLLILQIKSMEVFFNQHKEEYINDVGFRKAVDLMLSNILRGSFVGVQLNISSGEEVKEEKQ